MNFININLLSPVFLSIGPVKFHYYGLMYAISFLIAYVFLRKKLVIEKNTSLRGASDSERRGNPVIEKSYTLQEFSTRDSSEDQNNDLDSRLSREGQKITDYEFESMFFGTIIFGLIGGRLGEVLFYNLDYFIQYPVEIFYIWNGGMASHGGLLGGLLGFWFFRPKNINPLILLDSIALILPVGLALGRFGNLINGELYGYVTNVPWCMKFADGLCRHPTQIYAMIKDLFIFGVLMYLSLRGVKNVIPAKAGIFQRQCNDKIITYLPEDSGSSPEGQRITNYGLLISKPGFLTSLFLILYGILRFVIEFFKENFDGNNYFDFITTGQILSLMMILTGIYLLLKLSRK